MLRELSVRKGLDVSVAWADRNCSSSRIFSSEGIQYYVFPEPGRFVRASGVLRRCSDQLEYLFGHKRDKRAVAEAVAVVEDCRPDLVQVFGTEHYCGLIASLIHPPMILWIQGILDAHRNHYFGSMCYLERLRYPKLIWDAHRVSMRAEREREICRRCRYFIGRTDWDAAHLTRLQPQGHYYRVQECLRPEFYEAPPWTIDDDRLPTIYTTTSASLLKGTDVLIKAIDLLRSRHPDIRLRIAGLFEEKNPVARRISRLVKRLGLKDQVEFLGLIDSVQIVAELKRARVFVLPSFIENSPNSLGEAQLVGTPVVASSAGGMQDMVTDGKTGILCQAGDSISLAHQIERVLTDNALAATLAAQSRQAAQKRHAPARIVDNLLGIYSDILRFNGTSHREK